MTRVLVYFTKTKTQDYDEDLEIDTPEDEIDFGTVADALRAAYPLDNVELDDWEVLKEGEQS